MMALACDRCPTCGHRTPTVVTAGPMVLDLTDRHVSVNGRAVRMAPLEWRLLSALAASPGHTRAYEDLILAVWEDDSYTPHDLRIVVWRTRLRLGIAGPWVVAEAGGYSLAVNGTPPPVRRSFGGRRLPPGRWATDYAACVVCGQTDQRHHGRGACMRRACRRQVTGGRR